MCQRCTQAHRTCTYVIPDNRRKRVYAAPKDSADAESDHARPQSRSRSSAQGSAEPAAAGPEPPPAAQDENRVLAFYRHQYLSSISTKTPRWSFFSGIIHLGQANSALMGALMADARYSQATPPERREEDRANALPHYQGGLRDFASLASSRQFDPLTLLSTLFLLVQFELRHADQARDVRSHFEGFTTAVLAHGHQLIPALQPFAEARPAGSAAPPNVALRYENVLNRLGLWMTYMDALASTWDLGGSVMDTFWTRYPGSLELMFSRSRDALKEIWGSDYPPEEALDDLQNRAAFDLFHESHLLRYRASLFRWSLGDSDKAARLHTDIQAKIDALKQVRRRPTPCCYAPPWPVAHPMPQQHPVLMSIASKWPHLNADTTRIVLNLRFIVPLFHAVQVDFYRTASRPGQQPPALAQSVSEILQIAAIVHENEPPNSMCRIAWPLFVAGAETTDFVHSTWVLARFRELADVGVNFRRAHALLKAVVQHQRQTGEKVDYRQWLADRPEFETFII